MRHARREFDFELYTCRLGNKVRQIVNPFTNETIKVPIDLGLSAVERESVRSFLLEHGAEGPDPDGFYKVVFEKCHRVHLGFGNLDGDPPTVAAEVNVVGGRLSNEVLGLILQIAGAANMALRPLSGAEVVALVGEPQDAKVRERWPDAVVVRTSAELKAWLQQWA